MSTLFIQHHFLHAPHSTVRLLMQDSPDKHTVSLVCLALLHLHATRKQVFSLSQCSSNAHASMAFASLLAHNKSPGSFWLPRLCSVVHFRHYHNNICAYAMLGQSVPTLFRYDKIIKCRCMNTVYSSVRNIQFIGNIFPALILKISVLKKKSFLRILHLLNRCIDF